MTRHLPCALLVFGLAATAATAGETTPRSARPEAEKFTRLVADLGSDEFEVREAALKALEGAGPAARPALEKGLTSSDPDVRRLVRGLAERLARRQESAELLTPRRFRLSYRDVPLNFVLQDFTRLSGCRIILDPAISARLAEKKVTLDTGHTTFWEAYEQLCLAAGLTEMKPAVTPSPTVSPYTYRGGRALRQVAWAPSYAVGRTGLPTFSSAQISLTEGKPLGLPTFHSGAVRLRALPPETPLGALTATKGDQETFLALEVGAEPSVGWQGVQSLRVERAVDDRGQVLAQPQGFHVAGPEPRGYDDMMIWESSYSPYNNNSVLGGGEHVPVRLRLGPKPADRLVELRGTVSVKVQTPPVAIATIDNVMKSSGQGVKGLEGVQLRVVEMTREPGEGLKLRIQIEYPQPENQAGMWWGMRRWGGWHGQVEGGLPDLVLYDANGHLVRQVAAENLDDGTGGPMDYRVTFQPAPGQAEPAKLVWQGRRTATVDVPFTLRDVPLR